MPERRTPADIEQDLQELIRTTRQVDAIHMALRHVGLPESEKLGLLARWYEKRAADFREQDGHMNDYIRGKYFRSPLELAAIGSELTAAYLRAEAQKLAAE